MTIQKRGSTLLEAHSVINGERQDQYGNPEDAFGRIAEYWNCFLAKWESSVIDLKPKDVALMMVLFKLAREEHQAKRDNLVDAAGYIGLAGDMGGK